MSTRNGGYLCYLASAIRQAEFVAGVKDFGNKREKGSQNGSLEGLTGFFDMREIEGFAQCTNKCFIVADGFTRAVR